MGILSSSSEALRRARFGLIACVAKMEIMVCYRIQSLFIDPLFIDLIYRETSLIAKIPFIIATVISDKMGTSLNQSRNVRNGFTCL
jgi:hypothetical protein